MAAEQTGFMTLARIIAAGDVRSASQLLSQHPELSTARALTGATRGAAREYYLTEIRHYVYSGDSVLHIAAASHQPSIVRTLLDSGAGVGTRNRRGAEPLHYASDGTPGAANWRPDDQATTIGYLIDAGADPNTRDNSLVTPLHRAVRTRCAAAVNALLAGGADPGLPNKNGSTPMMLATHNTGRSGSGSTAAKDQQEQIVQLLRTHGATE